MATTINRWQTDLLFAGRTQVNESGNNGDLWMFLTQYGGITDTHYNDLVNLYNGWETDADNSNLIGTDSGGNHFPISTAPSRPRPVTK